MRGFSGELPGFGVQFKTTTTQILPSWGLVHAPDKALGAKYPGCMDGRVVADVVRLDKGQTER